MRKKQLKDQPSGIAAIYARYSSHAQNDASIEQQIDKCQEYARDNNLMVVAEYSDRAITGKTDRRPDFQRLMRDASQHKFDYVIAWKSNRIGRNMLEAMLNDNRLREKGIRCLYVEEDFEDNAAGRFAQRSMMNVNQFYSENMAEDIVRGLMENAQQCKANGIVPLGYKRGEDGRYEIDEPKAAIVREIFLRLNNGEMYVEIAEDLNSRGITTRTGKPWGKCSFHTITNNERYIGVYTYGDVRIEGGIPPIIDRDLFYSVQERCKMISKVKGRRNPNGEYLLTGKLYCGLCGAHMVGMSGKNPSGATYFYYACQSRRNGKNCQKENAKRDVIEKRVAEMVIDYILTDEMINWTADRVMDYQEKAKANTQLAYYQEKLKGVKVSISNIMKAIEAGIITETTRDRLVELESEQKKLNQEIAAETRSIPHTERQRVVDWMCSFKGLDPNNKAHQKKLIDMFVGAVYLFDDRIRIVYNFDRGRAMSKKLDSDARLGCEDGSGEPGNCSIKLSYAPPKQNAQPGRVVHSAF